MLNEKRYCHPLAKRFLVLNCLGNYCAQLAIGTPFNNDFHNASKVVNGRKLYH